MAVYVVGEIGLARRLCNVSSEVWEHVPGALDSFDISMSSGRRRVWLKTSHGVDCLIFHRRISSLYPRRPVLRTEVG
jgi:hypothetical protein